MMGLALPPFLRFRMPEKITQLVDQIPGSRPRGAAPRLVRAPERPTTRLATAGHVPDYRTSPPGQEKSGPHWRNSPAGEMDCGDVHQPVLGHDPGRRAGCAALAEAPHVGHRGARPG